MGKKIIFESFIHHFLRAASDISHEKDSALRASLFKVIDSFKFQPLSATQVEITSSLHPHFKMRLDYSTLRLYTRGDSEIFVKKLKEIGLLYSEDFIEDQNHTIMLKHARNAFVQCGLLC